jgi:hypothetical protein
VPARRAGGLRAATRSSSLTQCPLGLLLSRPLSPRSNEFVLQVAIAGKAQGEAGAGVTFDLPPHECAECELAELCARPGVARRAEGQWDSALVRRPLS